MPVKQHLPRRFQFQREPIIIGKAQGFENSTDQTMFPFYPP